MTAAVKTPLRRTQVNDSGVDKTSLVYAVVIREKPLAAHLGLVY
jgi:hypothetical protein